MPMKARSGKPRAIDVTVYVILRTLVILVLIAQIINRNYENVFLCVLTLILFLVPFWMDRRWNIKRYSNS